MEENFLFYAVLEGKRSGFCLRGVGMIESIIEIMSVFIYTVINYTFLFLDTNGDNKIQ
jgi:hypothetical protein